MRRTLWLTISHEVEVEGIREGTFFLGGGGLGPQRGGSSVKVSTKGGGPYPLFQLFKGRVTPFPEFVMGIFVMLFSIFL